MSRRFSQVFSLALIFVLCILFCAPAFPAEAQDGAGLLWDAWTSKDVTAIDDDNTGSKVALSDTVTAPGGAQTLVVTPSGASDETKIAVPFTGEALADLATYGVVTLDVFLPETNTFNPNRFFMGMADVTGEFAWAGGVFSETAAQPGWNQVVYRLDPAMQKPVVGHRYMLFLSFFNDANGAKTPLTEPFYLGAVYLAPAPAEAAAAGVSPYRAEVDILLRMNDDTLLDAIARETFDFFWYEADPTTGLIKDRSTPDSPSSIASVGFGLASIAFAVDRGWIDYERGYERVLTTLNTFLNGGVQGEHGFFFHFVTMDTGERVWGCEVSSIDTALLVAGALAAGEYFADTEVQEKAQLLYENVDWQWMMGGGDMPRMGWKPETGFLTSSWDHFDESMILYALAIGSPTHPIPAQTWQNWKRPVNISGEYIYLINDVLFVYQYPLAFLDLLGEEDAFANYWNNTTRACERNRQFAIDNAEKYATYRDGVWGISASDGPHGYRAYGASHSTHDGTIAPYASLACLPFTPKIALESVRAILTKYGAKAWGEYGLVSAINEDEDWFSTEHIGIDQGDALLMIANAQDGFVWNLFMQNANIQNAVEAMGFVESAGDYAVTPAYLAAVRTQ